MSKVLFINGSASGHVYPTLGIVEELIALDDQVVYVSCEEFREKLDRFDCLIHDSMYGCGNIVADFLKVPNMVTFTSFT